MDVGRHTGESHHHDEHDQVFDSFRLAGVCVRRGEDLMGEPSYPSKGGISGQEGGEQHSKQNDRRRHRQILVRLVLRFSIVGGY